MQTKSENLDLDELNSLCLLGHQQKGRFNSIFKNFHHERNLLDDPECDFKIMRRKIVNLNSSDCNNIFIFGAV